MSIAQLLKLASLQGQPSLSEATIGTKQRLVIPESDPTMYPAPHMGIAKFIQSKTPPGGTFNMLIWNNGEAAISVIRSMADLAKQGIKINLILPVTSTEKDPVFISYAKHLGMTVIVDAISRDSLGLLDHDEYARILKQHDVHMSWGGWGHMSEVPEVVGICNKLRSENGTDWPIFVGPTTPECMQSLGDKGSSDDMADKAMVQRVPGVGGAKGASLEEGLAYIREHGLPVMIKLSGGGGGTGNIRVYPHESKSDEEVFRAIYTDAVTKAQAKTGNPRVLVQKLIEPQERPKHIEVQVFRDQFGNVLRRGKCKIRECSVQRKDQKVIEEAPSVIKDTNHLGTAVGDLQRAAVNIANEAKYVNAGTCEFIMLPDGSYYFLEMNTRLQVEHPLTEILDGIDYKWLQLYIALGGNLADLLLPEDDLTSYNIEARICIENPKGQFKASKIPFQAVSFPGMTPNVRVDGLIELGNTVTGDSMEFKVIVRSPTGDKQEAIRTLREYLLGVEIIGPDTNIPFVLKLLEDTDFQNSTFYTRKIDEGVDVYLDYEDTPPDSQLAKTVKCCGLPVDLETRMFNHKLIPREGKPPATPMPPDTSKLAPMMDHPAVTINTILDETPLASKEPGKVFNRAVAAEVLGQYVDASRRGMHQVITDQRDRHQSMHMTRQTMSTSVAMHRPLVMAKKDTVFALQVDGGANPQVRSGNLGEELFVRNKRLTEEYPHVMMTGLCRGRNGVGFRAYPQSVLCQYYQGVSESGVREQTVFHYTNDPDHIESGVRAVTEGGGIGMPSLCYRRPDATGPEDGLYTRAYFEKVLEEYDKRGLLDLGILYIKSANGDMTAEGVGMLIDLIHEKYADKVKALRFHTHATADYSYDMYVAATLKCEEYGIASFVDLSTSAYARNPAQPDWFEYECRLANARGENPPELTPEQIAYRDYIAEMDKVYAVCDPLYGLTEEQRNSVLGDPLVHGMPGGQISNLIFQLMSSGLINLKDSPETWVPVWIHFRDIIYPRVNHYLKIIEVTPGAKQNADLGLAIVKFMTQASVIDSDTMFSVTADTVDTYFAKFDALQALYDTWISFYDQFDDIPDLQLFFQSHPSFCPDNISVLTELLSRLKCTESRLLSRLQWLLSKLETEADDWMAFGDSLPGSFRSFLSGATGMNYDYKTGTFSYDAIFAHRRCVMDYFVIPQFVPDESDFDTLKKQAESALGVTLSRDQALETLLFPQQYEMRQVMVGKYGPLLKELSPSIFFYGCGSPGATFTVGDSQVTYLGNLRDGDWVKKYFSVDGQIICVNGLMRTVTIAKENTGDVGVSANCALPSRIDTKTMEDLGGDFPSLKPNGVEVKTGDIIAYLWDTSTKQYIVVRAHKDGFLVNTMYSTDAMTEFVANEKLFVICDSKEAAEKFRYHT